MQLRRHYILLTVNQALKSTQSCTFPIGAVIVVRGDQKTHITSAPTTGKSHGGSQVGCLQPLFLPRILTSKSESLLRGTSTGPHRFYSAYVSGAGVGRVKPRDNASVWGTDNEAKVRNPEDLFFKKFAAECSRVQIAIDVFSCW